MATMTLDELVAQLRAAYGDSLRSVVLYGSAAAGEHIPKRSDYNVLVIADSLPADRLRAAAAVGAAWSASGSPPPMTLTLDEWRGSNDIFAMEYADIIERHKVLFGEPPFAGVAVARGDLRLQVEREAMGKLLQFRQGVLAAGNDPKRPAPAPRSQPQHAHGGVSRRLPAGGVTHRRRTTKRWCRR